MSKSGHQQWEITEEGLSKMTRTLGNLVGEDHNHIYSTITVKEIVPDSDISILSLCSKAVCSSAGRLVNTTGSAKYSLHNSKFVCWFHSSGGCAKKSITI